MTAQAGGGEWNTICACGAPTTTRICAVAYCAECAEQILGAIRERVIMREGMEGVGIRDGRNRPELGFGAVDLRCVDCGATWVGKIGDDCAWCERALERLRGWQAELLLRPELPEPDDRRFEGACRGWAERLARGVEAELITETQARAAWAREVGHVAA